MTQRIKGRFIYCRRPLRGMEPEKGAKKDAEKPPRAETPLARANRLHFDGTEEAHREALAALTLRELSRHLDYVERIRDWAEE